MNCFQVLVHGELTWKDTAADSGDPERGRLSGFYCRRYVPASGEKEAAEEAFRRVRENLNRQTGWLRDGLATLDWLLKPDNKGHAFYGPE